jgi:hypothetical protein
MLFPEDALEDSDERMPPCRSLAALKLAGFADRDCDDGLRASISSLGLSAPGFSLVTPAAALAPEIRFFPARIFSMNQKNMHSPTITQRNGANPMESSAGGDPTGPGFGEGDD